MSDSKKILLKLTNLEILTLLNGLAKVGKFLDGGMWTHLKHSIFLQKQNCIQNEILDVGNRIQPPK